MSVLDPEMIRAAADDGIMSVPGELVVIRVAPEFDLEAGAQIAQEVLPHGRPV